MFTNIICSLTKSIQEVNELQNRHIMPKGAVPVGIPSVATPINYQPVGIPSVATPIAYQPSQPNAVPMAQPVSFATTTPGAAPCAVSTMGTGN